jgi:hypothetical protein
MGWQQQIKSWASDRCPRARAYGLDWMMDNIMGPNAFSGSPPCPNGAPRVLGGAQQRATSLTGGPKRTPTTKEPAPKGAGSVIPCCRLGSGSYRCRLLGDVASWQMSVPPP